jgi:hypothetical protein
LCRAAVFFWPVLFRVYVNCTGGGEETASQRITVVLEVVPVLEGNKLAISCRAT